jgi:hypothetical protein
MRQIPWIASLLVLSACSINTTVAPTGAPAADVMNSRVIESPTSVFIAPDVTGLRKEVAISGYTCSAWSFPMSVGPGLAETLRLANGAAIKHLVPGGTATTPADGAAYHITVTMDGFEPRVSVAPQFWSGLANASAEITMRARVIDAKGMEILKTIVAGEGSAEETGDCPAASGALSTATGKAVKRVVENYVEKVINTGIIH